MSFLAPLWLLLAAAGGIPLVMHLLRRNPGPPTDFPAARYLARAEQDHGRSLRLRHLLLLVLRVLLILALAIAASRPFVRGPGTGHGPTALAIVLDNSMSTTALVAGTPVSAALRDAAVRLLRATTEADRLWLVTADGQVRSGTRDQLLGAAAAMPSLESAGDLALALRRAAAATATASLPARAVAVLTDAQATAWRTATRAPVPVSLFVPPGAPPDNRAVLVARAEPARWTPRGDIVAQLDAATPTAYRVRLGERTIARGTARTGETIRLPLATAERGWLGGSVEIDPDDFPADDRRWFALWAGGAPSIRADPSADAYVATAAGVLVAEGRATAGGGVRIAAADVQPALPALILPPASAARIGAANRALQRLGVPWKFGAVHRQPALARGALVDDVAITARYALERTGGAATDTLATAGGDAWMVGGPDYVLVGSRLTPEANALPVRAAFVRWLASVTGRLAAGAGQAGAVALDAVPGALVVLPDGADALERGDGTRVALGGGPVYAPTRRGVWFILRRGARMGALVVNAPASESALAHEPAAALAARLGGTGASVVQRAEALPAAVFAGASRRSALVPLLVVALVLFTAEAVLVRRTRVVGALRPTRSIVS